MTYKRTSVNLMIFVTALLCFCALLLSTPWGARLSLYLLNHLSTVQVAYKSGAILNDLNLSQLQITNEKADINAHNIRLKLHLKCLWKKQLCIDELSVGSLQVTLANNEAAVAQPLDTIIIPSLLPLPLSVKVKKLSWAKVQIKNPHTDINLTDFSSALLIDKHAITLEHSTLASASINVYSTSVSSPAPKPSPVPSSLASTWPLASLPKVSLPFHLAIKSFAVKSFIINDVFNNNEVKTRLNLTDSLARLSWFNTQLTIDTLASTVADFGTVALQGNIALQPPYTVDLTIDNRVKQSALVAQLNHSNQQVLVHGRLTHLSIHAKSQGSLALTADATIDITKPQLPYHLAAHVTQLSFANELTNIIQPEQFTLTSQGDINEHNIELNTEFNGLGYHNATLALAAKIQKNTLLINKLHFQDNDNNNLAMAGELVLGDKLSWNVNINSSGITLPSIDKRIAGRVLGNITSSGFWQADAWALRIDNSVITGDINNLNLNAKANIDINHKGELSASTIELNYDDIALQLKGYSDVNWHLDGIVNIASSDLWLENIDTNLSTTIAVSGPIQQPEISLEGEFKHLIMANLASEAVRFKAKYSPHNNHQHQVNFTTLAMNINEHKINQVNFSSHGDLNQQQLQIAWLGDSSVDLHIDSQYSAINQQWQLMINNPAFSLAKYDVKSNQAIQLSYNILQKTLSLNKHCWLADMSTLCLKHNSALQLDNGKLDLALTVNETFFSPFIPKDFVVQSTVNGDLSMAWQQGEISAINANLLINEGNIKLYKDDELNQVLQWQTGLLNVQMHNQNIATNIVLSANDHVELVNAQATISLLDKAIVDSQVIIHDFNLAPLQFLAPELPLFEGSLNTNFSVQGDLSHPNVNGSISISQGKTKISEINLLEDINLLVTLQGQQAVISGGLTVNQQTAQLRGNLVWQDELQGEFNVDGESLYVSIPPDLTLTVSPHLNAQIKATELKLSGRIDVVDGKLVLNKLPQGSVSLSKDVIFINDEGMQVVKDTPFDITTNIRLLISDTFNVEGQGFVGHLGGELQVNQQPQQPLQLFGSLKIPDGRYRAYGQDLSIKKGSIAFNGSTNNPYIAMQATRTIDKEDIIVGIDATGQASNLQLKLFSKPLMQQSEILSYLVRGRGLDAKTNNSSVALGVAVGAAMTNFSGILGQLEKLPLISNIEVEGDDQQASIAGYLSDQVYIKYGVGVTEPIKELTVRFYLLTRLWVEAVSGLENSANIYYSFDID